MDGSDASRETSQIEADDRGVCQETGGNCEMITSIKTSMPVEVFYFNCMDCGAVLPPQDRGIGYCVSCMRTGENMDKYRANERRLYHVGKKKITPKKATSLYNKMKARLVK